MILGEDEEGEEEEDSSDEEETEGDDTLDESGVIRRGLSILESTMEVSLYQYALLLLNILA